MRPRQDQDSNRQTESSATPYVMEIPPPGYPMRDFMRMTGQLPTEAISTFLTQVKAKRDELSSSQTTSPLNSLFAKVYHFFDKGTQIASFRFAAIQTSVTMGEAEVKHSAYQAASRALVGNGLPWNSCKLAATLVLLHAVPKDVNVMFEALKFQSHSLGGLPTMSMISVTPSASLAPRFAQAKKAAIDGKVGKCTVLSVSLVDVEMIERGENGNKPMGYSSFAHTFVLAVGREGWRVFQSWGEHGYTLEEYLKRDGARLRHWKEATAFLKAFLVLATAEGSWSQKINDAYETCFEVNIFRICSKRGPQEPIVPIYRPWVRFFEVEDVKESDIEKFTWDRHCKNRVLVTG